MKPLKSPTMAKQYKLPWIKFWTKAWKEKTRKLSGEARGVWIDLICEMWEQPRRGTITVSIESLARMLILPEKVVQRAIIEIINLGICDSDLKIPVVINTKNQFFTLRSRRIVRDEKRRKSDAVRKTESKGYNKIRKQSEPVPQTIQSDSANNPSHERIRVLEDKKIREREIQREKPPPTFEQVSQYLNSEPIAFKICEAFRDLNITNYPRHLNKFLGLKGASSKNWKSLQDANEHFVNWLLKQDLSTPIRKTV